MKVVVAKGAAGPEASLVDPLEFTGFSLNVQAGVDMDTVRTMVGIVRLESDEQAWISSEWLLAQQPYASDASARQGVEKMIEYARTHGWIDDERGEIAAHVVHE